MNENTHRVAAENLSLRLAEAMAGPVPAEARAAALVSLGDALGCMVAGAALEPSTAPFRTMADGGPATVVRGGSGTAGAAAMANGAAAHAVDFEDTFEESPMHPNAPAVPALLALAEAEGIGGAALLDALAWTSDLACRMGLGLASDPAARSWYHPPVIAGIAAAMGCARLLGLPAAGAVDAAGLAFVQFSLTDGLKESPESHLRGVRDAFAARAAVEGALLARMGVRALADPLAGRGGLYAMLTGAVPRGRLTEGLGAHFHGPEVVIKRWPSCRGTHPAIDVALTLRGDGVTAEEIEAVEMQVWEPDSMLFLPEADRLRPREPIAARFSVPFSFASAMVHGAPGLAAFSGPALEEAAVLALAARVRMTEEVTRGAPIEAVVRLKGGATRRCPLAFPKEATAGDLQVADLTAKFGDCFGAAGAAAEVPRLIAALEGLETAPDVSGLTAVLRRV